MHTEIVIIHPDDIDPAPLNRAAEIIRRGGLVAFPTETVYGLGANALDSEAVKRIYLAKGRPSNNPLIVHVASPEEALMVASEWPERAARLAERFWPGPLTLVLPRRSEIPDAVTGGGVTVAVRLPAHPVARALISAAGVPLAAPSANRSQRISPTTADHVRCSLGGRIEMILDGGSTQVGVESTVLDLVSEPPRLLRPGHITPAMIEEVIGPIEVLQFQAGKKDGPLLSPGMLTRHYAPHAPLELHPDSGAERVDELLRAGGRVGWLPLGHHKYTENENLVVYPMPVRPASYAAKLYAALYRMDEAGVERIVAQTPPDGEAWMASLDRLRRASARE